MFTQCTKAALIVAEKYLVLLDNNDFLVVINAAGCDLEPVLSSTSDASPVRMEVF